MNTSRRGETVVDISDLFVSFASDQGAVKAVDGVSFEVGRGEVVAVVGESGSGKTVTAKTILGLLPETATTSGVVMLGGRQGGQANDVVSVSRQRLQQLRGSDVAMVFQEPSTALNPVFTVGWQIAEGLRAHTSMSRRETRAKAIDILRKVGIPDPETRVDYYPHQLSGGQKQRVVIAMALVLEPGLIVADEPTTALDVTVQAEILDLLRRCRDEFDASILLITHNLGVVADLADRVVVMYQGHVVEERDVQGLFAAPEDDYTKRLLAAVPYVGQGTAGAAARAEARAAAPESVPLVEAVDLRIQYPGRLGRPGFVAVDGVSFRLAPGEVLGLVGESGSGKTTIGRAIAGLTRVTGGSLSVLGQEMNGVRERSFRRLRGDIGFVFQDPAASFNPLLTIAECVAEPLIVHGHANGWRRSAAGVGTARGGAAARGVRRSLPARAERRPAAAGELGPSARPQPEVAGRGRAHLGARRLGAGSRAGAVRRAAGRVRVRRTLHQSRSSRRRSRRRSDRGAVSREARRGGSGVEDPGRTGTPVHATAAGVAAGSRPGRPGRPSLGPA